MKLCNQTCCGAVSRVENKISNPVQTSTIEKVYRYAGVIFLFAVAAIAIVSIVIKYPAASTTFYSLLSVTAVLSLVAFAIAWIRRKGQPGQELIPNGTIPNFPQATPSNPFSTPSNGT